MRPQFFRSALVFFLMCFCALAGDHESRVADIMDQRGTLTYVTGLHYCYEEMDNGELYLTKYDEFFVKRGDAIIKVHFDSLSHLEFTGEQKKSGDSVLRSAKILTRTGKEVFAEILCHKGSFIKGKVDLGEFTIQMDKIKKMDFSSKGNPDPEFIVKIFPRGETPGNVLALILNKDGKLTLQGETKEIPKEALKAAIKSKAYTVFIRSEADTPYAVLVKKLHLIHQAGARRVLLGP